MEKCLEVHQQLNLQNCIKALLLDADGNKLKSGFLVGHYEVDEEQLVRLLRHECDAYTLDQLKAVARMYYTHWEKEGATMEHVKYAMRPTLFNLLLHFVDAGLLHMDGNDTPVCQWEGLLRWHDLTARIGEDIMVCAYLAGHDLISPNTPKRINFNWAPFVRTDDPTLNVLLEMPLADIHAHLKGSSLNFDINWICLMNHINDRLKTFSGMTCKVQSDHSDEKRDEHDLYKKAVLAASIRLHLLSMLYLKRSDVENLLMKLMGNIDVMTVEKTAQDLQGKIEYIQKSVGERYTSSESGDSVIFDYAIIRGTSIDQINSLTLLSGERYLIYQILKDIYSDQIQDRRMDFLFFLYLVLKNEIRHEITQLNETVGFDNFSIYEDRKMVFVEGYDYYEDATLHLAIKGFFGDINPTNRYHEARITPKNTGLMIEKSIKKIDHAIESDLLKKENVKWDYKYIFHFIKYPDDSKLSDYRHFTLRASVKEQAWAIYKFRNQLSTYPDGTFIADRAVGIDAANSEIACRPEVFAHAFRFLRHHTIEHPEIHRPHELGITYHVGEDFMDIVDGLRAMSEAILFLQLRKGDRIGHGLVLGVDVDEYYRIRNYTIAMSLQMMMDNMAWMYHYVKSLKGFSNILDDIKEKFEQCYRRVYNGSLLPSINIYYASMLLRGDNPECYEADGTVRNPGGGIDEWLSKSLNSDRTCSKAREMREARMLYHQYHYCQEGKQNGAIYTEWIVTKEIIDAIKVLQQRMLQQVEEIGLAIECNPTSNIKIGEFNRYDEHPILRFNNEGLNDYHKQAISVSINTDDKGVFATSIEREYALIAHSAIRYFRMNDSNISDNDIYNWLDRIRMYSLSQRFDKSNTRLDSPRMDTIEKYRMKIMEEAQHKNESGESWWRRVMRWMLRRSR